MDELLKELCAVFGVDPNPCTISQIGWGHNHDSYLLERCEKGQPPLILQRINDFMFKDIELLMHNIELVTAHISFKNRQRSHDPAQSGIVLLETDEGDSWIGNEKLGYWRMFWYIENHKSYKYAESEQIAYQGGKAIAEFQGMLVDIDVDKIGESASGYFDLRRRIQQFEEAVEGASTERLKKAAVLRELVAEYSGKMLELYIFSEEHDIPIRITHNDAKFDNILFNEDDEANCMIDLDMVMQGYVWYDFGEAIRSCMYTAVDDEEDLMKIGFRIDFFEAFARGYIETGSTFLTDDELKTLHRAPALFAYMQALNFLIDYLNEDVYYKICYEEQNFIRARAQFALMQEMYRHEEEMRVIVEQVYAIQEK